MKYLALLFVALPVGAQLFSQTGPEQLCAMATGSSIAETRAAAASAIKARGIDCNNIPPPAPPPSAPPEFAHIKTMVDVETLFFADFRKNVPPPYNDWTLAYWQRRMDLAADFDAGRITFEGWQSAKKAADAMYGARLESEMASLKDRHAAERAAEADRRRRDSAILLDAASRMLAPRPSPTINCITTTTSTGGVSTTNCR